jgi:hypothetical protein
MENKKSTDFAIYGVPCMASRIALIFVPKFLLICAALWHAMYAQSVEL